MKSSNAVYPSLVGRKVFISGGASGIGRAIVEAFIKQGSKVYTVDIDQEALDKLASEIPNNLKVAQIDLCNIPSLQKQLKEWIEADGAIDILVNNAARDQRLPLLDMSEENWDHLIGTNLRHYAFAIQSVLPGMLANKSGSIINMGSVSWKAKNTGMLAYTSCKAAVNGMTRPLAKELGPAGIRVNTVIPGAVLTERQAKLWRTPESVAEIQAGQCLPGDIMPEDIAAMVLFLGADDSKMCTANEFVVDAGWS